jgi:hypothetical protein
MIDSTKRWEPPVAPEEIGVDRMAGDIAEGSEASVQPQSEPPIERVIDVLLDEVDLVEEARRRSQTRANSRTSS